MHVGYFTLGIIHPTGAPEAPHRRPTAPHSTPQLPTATNSSSQRHVPALYAHANSSFGLGVALPVLKVAHLLVQTRHFALVHLGHVRVSLWEGGRVRRG